MLVSALNIQRFTKSFWKLVNVTETLAFMCEEHYFLHTHRLYLEQPVSIQVSLKHSLSPRKIVITFITIKHFSPQFIIIVMQLFNCKNYWENTKT